MRSKEKLHLMGGYPSPLNVVDLIGPLGAVYPPLTALLVGINKNEHRQFTHAHEDLISQVSRRP